MAADAFDQNFRDQHTWLFDHRLGFGDRFLFGHDRSPIRARIHVNGLSLCLLNLDVDCCRLSGSFLSQQWIGEQREAKSHTEDALPDSNR